MDSLAIGQTVQEFALEAVVDLIMKEQSRLLEDSPAEGMFIVTRPMRLEEIETDPDAEIEIR